MLRFLALAGRLGRLAVVPTAVLAGSVVVASASYSAFSATTANPSNSWTTGTVALGDDDAGTALFTATGLKPGSTGSNCIAVTSTGTSPSSVQLYGTGYSGAALGSTITLTIAQGTGGGFGSCGGFTQTGGALYSGTLDGFGTSATSYATGLGAWTPTGSGSETRVFKFSYTVGQSAPQGSSASLGFTWEAQNT